MRAAALPTLALLLGPAAASFVVTTGFGCGGAGHPKGCNTGKSQGDLHYAFMGDLALSACQAKCEELGCPWCAAQPPRAAGPPALLCFSLPPCRSASPSPAPSRSWL